MAKKKGHAAQVVDAPSDRKTRTQKYLDKQPKETILLPTNTGEVGVQEVNYNGVKYVIPLGVRVEVPKPIATLLWDKLIAEQRLVDASRTAVKKMEAQ